MRPPRTISALFAVTVTLLASVAVAPLAHAEAPGADRSLSASGATGVEGTLRRVVVDGSDEFSGAHAGEADHALRTVTVAEVDGRALRIPDDLAAGIQTNSKVRLTLNTPTGVSGTSALAWAASRGATAVIDVQPVRTINRSLVAGTTVAGAHTLTILPVYWSAKDTATVASLTTLAQRTASYWQQQSAGKVTMSVSVRDWKQIPAQSTCDFTGIYNAAASAHGISTPGGLDHVLVYFPYFASCSWAGLAYVGGNVIWDNGYDLLDVTAHEFGHNLGLGHANTYSCTGGTGRVPLSSSCTTKEYYDRADVMGFATYSDSGSLNVGFADFLGLATVTEVSPTATSPVTVDLASLSGYAGMRGVRIPVTGGKVYVEFRPASGRDVRQSSWAGVQVRMITSDYAPASRLLDMQPWASTAFATNTSSAVSMVPYEIWPIPGTSVSVKVTQVGTTATVAVVPTKSDTTKPSAVTLTSPGAGAKLPSLTTASWSAATDAGAGVGAYRLIVDGAIVARVAGDVTSTSLSGIGTGSHTLRVDAVDNAGNVSSGVPATVTVDSAASSPAARILTPAANALVTASPRVTWTLDVPVATSVVLVDGAEAARTTSTAATLSGLSEGSHTIAVRTLDGSGATLATSAAVTVTVDTVVPTTPASLRYTSATSTLDWTASTDANGLAGYDVRMDGTLLGRATTNSYRITLPSGSHTWTVTAIDKAGNASTAASLSTESSSGSGGSGGTTNTPVITSPTAGAVIATSRPTVTFTGVTDATTRLLGYIVTIDGKMSRTLLAPDATSFVTGTLRDGVHKFAVSAVSRWGVITPSTTVTATVDTAKPAAPRRATMSGTTLTWMPGSDRTSGVAAYQLLRDGVTVATVSGATTSATVTMPVGRHVWSVRTVDRAGLVSSTASAPAVWYDPSAPTTPAILSPTTGSATAKTRATLTWGASTDSDSGLLGYRITVNGVAARRLVGPAMLTASVALRVGTNTVSVSAVNLAGVPSEAAAVAVRVDTTAASVPVLTLPRASSTASAASLAVAWQPAVDVESGIAGYEVLVNGVVMARTNGSTTSANITIATTTSRVVNVAVRVRNGAGKVSTSASVRATVTVAAQIMRSYRTWSAV